MPFQRQSLTDILLSYSREAAYIEFQEQQKGQIKIGYLADLMLLPEAIFAIPTEEISGLKPALTMVDGRVVHEA